MFVSILDKFYSYDKTKVPTYISSLPPFSTLAATFDGPR